MSALLFVCGSEKHNFQILKGTFSHVKHIIQIIQLMMMKIIMMMMIIIMIIIIIIIIIII